MKRRIYKKWRQREWDKRAECGGIEKDKGVYNEGNGIARLGSGRKIY